MKILYVTTIAGTLSFFVGTVEKLLEDNNEVFFACNNNESRLYPKYKEWPIPVYNISCTRSPFNFGNIKAIGQIKKAVVENKIDLVHCHTPIASFCTRIACASLRKKGLVVVYTAHGFHFYKGAPKKNWLVYYPLEKMCSSFTDAIITINEEDYFFSSKHFSKAKTYLVHGVGVDLSYFSDTVIDVEKKRTEIGIKSDAFVVLSVGELNKNKNHRMIIDALSLLNLDIVYIIAGAGGEYESLETYAEMKKVQLKLLGHRSDVNELYKLADLFAMPSYREGLPVSLIEAMASGLPVVASDIRGVRDIVKANGILCEPDNCVGFAEAIKHYYNNRSRFDNKCYLSKFSCDSVNEEIIGIYKSFGR